MSKKLSGAEYRKRKKEKDDIAEIELKKVRKLSSYFSTKPSVTQEPSCSSQERSCSSQEPSCSSKDKDVSFSVGESEQLLTTENRSASKKLEGEVSLKENESEQILSQYLDSVEAENEDLEEQEFLEKQVGEDFVIISSSDKGNFEGNLTAEEKKQIIKLGPHQPKGPFPKDTDGRNKNRGFDEKWYFQKKADKHLSIKRNWLCYSKVLNVCYCQPCWLFNMSQRDVGFSKGTSDWAHLGRNIKDHEEESQNHAIACEVHYRWQLGMTVDSENLEDIKRSTDYWRQVLRRVVDVIITLATNDLPLREHRLSGDANLSKGNFLEIIHMLAKYDKVLADLIKLPKGSTNYLSPQIQNEIINLIANEIKKEIKEEMVKSPYVCIIFDTTQDISKTDQLSTVFRYVKIKTDNEERPVELVVEEAFGGFTEVESQKSEYLENVVLKVIEEFSDISKVRGQGYDGAANMSGIYSGLQARIKSKNPAATYVHCCAHALNLVINDSVTSIPEIRNFFDNVQNLYVFFKAVSRWALLTKSTMKKTLKKVCPTRWSSRNTAIDALRCGYFDIMKVLTVITLQSSNQEEVNQAKSLLKYFEQFQTVILIVVQSVLLETMDIISKKLQSTEEDLEHATRMLLNLKSKIANLRSNWETIKNDATQLCLKWKVAPNFTDSRSRKKKRMFDEVQADDPIMDKEKRFQVEVFNRSLDIITTQLTERFESITEICACFKCLKPSFLTDSSDKEILDSCKPLVLKYPDDISPNLGQQLVRLKTCFSSHIEKLKSIRDLADTVIVRAQVGSSFPDVVSACLIFLTMPVTSASAERSFSKLKIIKSYLRSTMSQERLSSLATISIERARARNIDLEDTISQFASAKSRKKI